MLKEMFVKKIGDKALLYTTDGSATSYLRCGFVPGAYATIDFGTSSNVTKSFLSMRLYQPRVSDLACLKTSPIKIKIFNHI